ncbi:hypothetical protein RRF57_000284 [Xylaria bambusicola]|uniref:Uncharacterized protein n=1 Tax=Xylaria bambusicola TaxID=326684 RepID=A0AAN7U9W9_9PEZI
MPTEDINIRDECKSGTPCLARVRKKLAAQLRLVLVAKLRDIIPGDRSQRQPSSRRWARPFE